MGVDAGESVKGGGVTWEVLVSESSMSKRTRRTVFAPFGLGTDSAARISPHRGKVDSIC
jgi:hypothetical protein